MSSRSQILAFDYDKFVNVVIPALIEGEENKLVKEVVERSGWNVRFYNLSKVISLFNDDLTECSLGKTFVANDKGVYRYDKEILPSSSSWGYWDLAGLLERLILKHCIKYCLPIGKAVRLELVLDSKEINTKLKLEKLCHGSFIWVHCSADDNGIYGWIDNDDTKFLVKKLITFVKPEDPRLKEHSEEIIDSIKKIIRIASNEGLGLLYGNSLDFDIIGDPKYYQIIKLIKNEEYLGGCPRYNFKNVKDYS